MSLKLYTMQKKQNKKKTKKKTKTWDMQATNVQISLYIHTLVSAFISSGTIYIPQTVVMNKEVHDQTAGAQEGPFSGPHHENIPLWFWPA